ARGLAAALALAGLAALGGAAALAAKVGPGRLWARLTVSSAEVAECERVREAVLPLFDRAPAEEVLARVARVVPLERVARLELTVWMDGGDFLSGVTVLKIERCAAADLESWDDDVEAGNLRVTPVASGAVELLGRRPPAELARLAAGPLAPLGATLTAASRIALDPAPRGAPAIGYARSEGGREVEVILLRP
ncbi:MAG TPA: hypothetical protein VHF22_14255, partial [Planctomycetota bacterium]|nr:hypothetical protein [Planctomycetota bacterium]